MKMKKLVGCAPIAFATTLAFWFAARPAGAEDGVSAGEVLVGQCAALTGPAAALGQGMNAGLRAALEEQNAAGGVHGRKLRLIAVDDGYEPERTVDRTAQLIEGDKVFALAGYVGTPTAKVAVPIVTESKVPLVGIFSGAMLLREPVQRYVINVRASYDDETEALVAHFVGHGKASRFAVFYQNDSFGLAGLSGTEKALARRGLKLVAKGSFERNTLAVKSGLVAVLDGKPDAVVIIGPYKPTAAFVHEFRAAGARAALATISFVGTESLILEAGKDADGVIISQVVPSPEAPGLPLVKAYQGAIARLTPAVTPSYTTLEGYLTGRLLIEALGRLGTEPTREKLVDAIEAMEALDLGGIRLSFSAASHQGGKTIFLTSVVDGKARPIKQ